MRWTRERSGAAVVGLAGVFVAGGMGGESTALRASDKGSSSNIHGRELEVHLGRGGLTRSRAFAGLSWTAETGTVKRPGCSARSFEPSRNHFDHDLICARTRQVEG